MKLSADMPRMSSTMLTRVDAILAGGCNASQWGGCPNISATLRRRPINGGVMTVHLQCDGCGRSLGGALARDGHFTWQDYPLWDDGLREKFQALQQQETATYLRKLDEQSAQAAEARAHRRAEYAEWCRASPEWAAAKKSVFWRSRSHCEACLTNTATTVHHLTYEMGKLPPLWELRAVCDECHERLHDPDDEWCTAGMAR